VSDGEDNRSLAGWWNRVRRRLPGAAGRSLAADHPSEERPPFVSKSLRPFLDAMREVPAPVIIDLGSVVGANVAFLGEHLRCKLHPEDVRSEIDRSIRDGDEARLATRLAGKIAQAPGSVDGILAWDVFDRLQRPEAKALAERLVSVLRPGGLLVAWFSTVPPAKDSFRTYVIVDDDHLRWRLVAAPARATRPWLVRDVEVLLAPLEVLQTRLAAHHLRETLLRQPIARRKEG
jgi:hypothetical protein